MEAAKIAAICPTLTSQPCKATCPYSYHSDLRYMWALRPAEDPSGPLQLLSPDLSKLIEKHFCDPKTDFFPLDDKDKVIDFLEMTCSTRLPARQHEGPSPARTLDLFHNGWFGGVQFQTQPLVRISVPPRSLILDPEYLHNGEIWAWYCHRQNAGEDLWTEVEYASEEYIQQDNSQMQKFQDLEQEFHRNSPPEGKMVLELDPTTEMEVDDDFAEYSISPHNAASIYILNFGELTMTKPGSSEVLHIRRRPQTFSAFVEWSYLDNFSQQFEKAIVNNMNWISFGEIDPAGNVAFPELPQSILEGAFQQGMESISSIVGLQICLRKGDLHMIAATSTKKEGRITRRIRIRRDVFKGDLLLKLTSFPPMWDPMPATRIYTTVVVSPSSEEFHNVLAKLRESVLEYDIYELRRIQNPAAVLGFRKEKAAFPNSTELQLFHGTKRLSLRTICEQNFHVELAGHAVGTAYGKGVYFASQARTSLHYAERFCINKEQERRTVMFLAKVLITNLVQGDPLYEGDINATLVNRTNSPSIYVKPKANTFYPEYLLFLKPNN